MTIMIGVDLAKNVFQVHGATMTGDVLFSKKLTRSKFREFMVRSEPAIIVMNRAAVRIIGRVNWGRWDMR